MLIPTSLPPRVINTALKTPRWAFPVRLKLGRVSCRARRNDVVVLPKTERHGLAAKLPRIPGRISTFVSTTQLDHTELPGIRFHIVCMWLVRVIEKEDLVQEPRLPHP